MYCLVATIPLAKKVYRLITVETDIEKSEAIQIAREEATFILEEINRMKMFQPRAFHRPPKFLLFTLMSQGNPRLGNNRKIGSFRLWLDSGEVEITKRWQ